MRSLCLLDMVEPDRLFRLFLAVETPPQIRNRLVMLQHSIGRLEHSNVFRWIGEENFHITLHFLGNAAGAAIPQITDAISRACSRTQPFQLTTSGLGFFPDNRRPRVLWSGVTDASGLFGRLYRTLSEELADCCKVWNLPLRTSQHFHPHVTLAYVRNNAARDQVKHAVAQVLGMPTEDSSAFVARDVVLVHSTLTKSGSVYRVLGRDEFDGSGRQSGDG